MKTPHESQVERARRPKPPVKDSFMLKLHKPTYFPAITACQTARSSGSAWRGISPSPIFCWCTALKRIDLWDRTHVLLLRTKGLLVRASLELDEPLSWHPALRVCSGA